MNDYRVGLNEAEIDAIFEVYDVDLSGAISYEEFLRGIRGKMNGAFFDRFSTDFSFLFD